MKNTKNCTNPIHLVISFIWKAQNIAITWIVIKSEMVFQYSNQLENVIFPRHFPSNTKYTQGKIPKNPWIFAAAVVLVVVVVWCFVKVIFSHLYFKADS